MVVDDVAPPRRCVIRRRVTYHGVLYENAEKRSIFRNCFTRGLIVKIVLKKGKIAKKTTPNPHPTYSDWSGYIRRTLLYIVIKRPYSDFRSLRTLLLYKIIYKKLSSVDGKLWLGLINVRLRQQTVSILQVATVEPVKLLHCDYMKVTCRELTWTSNKRCIIRITIYVWTMCMTESMTNALRYIRRTIIGSTSVLCLGSLASTLVYCNSVPCTDDEAADPERTVNIWAGQARIT